MNSRTIYYSDDGEDHLDGDVERALSSSLDKNLQVFYETIIANYAMMNIDGVNFSVKREIHFIGKE